MKHAADLPGIRDAIQAANLAGYRAAYLDTFPLSKAEVEVDVEVDGEVEPVENQADHPLTTNTSQNGNTSRFRTSRGRAHTREAGQTEVGS